MCGWCSPWPALRRFKAEDGTEFAPDNEPTGNVMMIGALTLRSSRARLYGLVGRRTMVVRSLPADDVEDDAGEIVDEGADVLRRRTVGGLTRLRLASA